MRPFRFMATLPVLDRGFAAWRDDLQAIDDAGFDTVVVADHFTGGWCYEPFVALTAASQANRRLRLQTNVLSNDYRHPVLTHRSAAALDVFSDGRFELGIGAGWMATDYVAAGLDFDPPAERVARLAESVRAIKALFGGAPVSLSGTHYVLRDLTGAPAPVQRPHPPIFLGGGRKGVLSLAGREADIVGVHSSLDGGRVSAATVAEMTPERVAEKIRWVSDAAESVGRSLADIELSMNFRFCAIVESADEASARLAAYAKSWGLPVELLARSPQVLVGSPEQAADTLLRLRERFGISYFHFDPSPHSPIELEPRASVMALARAADRIAPTVQ